eukprot:CAMPEP_0179369608 /NCGR_PEP_ID=MMETSP0797-20121207/84702_1 /TAXON_ID=47934 /ORGANISM="Dinophysis acuminata, Strain DAEP01" /LENGTH=270 /DNA_ID=CAMNT_0021085243 /DNA_START=338 /DNA_END=1147 /DNA_ORIENTATION=+
MSLVTSLPPALVAPRPAGAADADDVVTTLALHRRHAATRAVLRVDGKLLGLPLFARLARVVAFHLALEAHGAPAALRRDHWVAAVEGELQGRGPLGVAEDPAEALEPSLELGRRHAGRHRLGGVEAPEHVQQVLRGAARPEGPDLPRQAQALPGVQPLHDGLAEGRGVARPLRVAPEQVPRLVAARAPDLEQRLAGALDALLDARLAGLDEEVGPDLRRDPPAAVRGRAAHQGQRVADLGDAVLRVGGEAGAAERAAALAPAAGRAQAPP